MRFDDAVTGGFFAASGVGLAWWAHGMKVSSSGFFPIAVSLVMALAGTGLLVTSFARGVGPLILREGWMASPAGVWRVLVVPLALALYPLAAPRLGAALTGTAIVWIVAWSWGRPPVFALGFALISAFVVFFAFRYGLGVPLPAGRLLEGSW